MTTITIKQPVNLKKNSFNDIYELMVELSKYINSEHSSTSTISQKKKKSPLLDYINSDEYKTDKGTVYENMSTLVADLQKYKN